MLEWGRSCKPAVILDSLNHYVLKASKIAVYPVHNNALPEPAPVELLVNYTVLNRVHDKAHQARNHNLAILPVEKFLQVIVSQTGELNVNLSYNSYLYLALFLPFNIFKGKHNLLHQVLHFPLFYGPS